MRTVEIPAADRRELLRRARAKGSPAREVERARIVLLAAEGVPGKRIAAMAGCAEPTAVTWRRRYAEQGLAGLEDHPRPGSPSPLPEALPELSQAADTISENIVAQVDPNRPPAKGERVHLRIQPGKEHLFSPSTGRRLPA